MKVNALIVGGGPAGLAPLIAASRSSALDDIMSSGVGIVERGVSLGGGRIGRYAINSDSTASTLVSCIFESAHSAFAALRTHPAVEAIKAYGSTAVPLGAVERLMMVIGEVLRDLLHARGNPIFLGYEAISTSQDPAGDWQTRLRRISDRTEISVSSRFVVLATGGHQPLSAIESRVVGGEVLLARYATKLIQSDDALTEAGLRAIGDRLVAGRTKRVAIIGSSSSAMACANALLKTEYGKAFEPRAVTVLHRRPFRVFYPSVTEALEDGYVEFDADDICPISGFVYRLSGLRLEARELLMAVREIGGRAPERRLHLHQVGAESDPLAVKILDECDVVIAALGYRPRALPVLTASGAALPLFAEMSDSQPLVDDACRVLDQHGAPIEGLMGIGLASGFFSRDIVGGEQSFSGQTNSLWQWQNAVGGLVARQIREGAVAQLETTRTKQLTALSV
jgi:hypothetical protein